VTKKVYHQLGNKNNNRDESDSFKKNKMRGIQEIKSVFDWVAGWLAVAAVVMIQINFF